MATTKRKLEGRSAQLVSAEQEPLQQVSSVLTDSRLADAIRDMATKHFRKIDEVMPNLAVDESAERKIKALFDKHASDVKS